MRSRLPSLALACMTLAACGPGGPPSPPGLAYGLPTKTAVTYAAEARADIDIDAEGQSMQAQGSSSMTLDVAFAESSDGLGVTMEVREFQATQSNPMGSQSADEEGIEGPVVFTLDRTGEATLVAEPVMTGTTDQFFQPLELAYGFFPKLPGRAADVGESWTDTVSYEGTPADGKIKVTSVLEYTMVGDTVIGGSSLLKISFEGTVQQVASGQITGMDFSQNLSGTTSGWHLWDSNRRLLVQSHAEGDLRGSMEVAAAPFPLTVRVRQQEDVHLQDGM
jgi:hypothetical protein